VIINQPGTYPAREIPVVGDKSVSATSALVSGFVAVDLMKAVKPMKLLATLRRANYEIDIDTQRCRRDHHQLFIELAKTLEARRAVAGTLWESEEWDYFQVVVTGTDRLQHYLFSAVEDEGHPRHAQTIQYYQTVEELLKETWERYHASVDVSREGEGFFLLSDHGFCLIEQEVYVNAWLREQGYLKFTKDPPEGLHDISPEATAFALDPARIYLHRAGKYPRGGLSEAETPALAAEIREKLLALCYHDKKVIELVKTRDEAYAGPEAVNGPDLVAVAHHGFDLKGSPVATEIFGKSDLTGMHTWDDAFFWSLENAGADLDITRLADIVTRPILK